MRAHDPNAVPIGKVLIPRERDLDLGVGRSCYVHDDVLRVFADIGLLVNDALDSYPRAEHGVKSCRPDRWNALPARKKKRTQ